MRTRSSPWKRRSPTLPTARGGRARGRDVRIAPLLVGLDDGLPVRGPGAHLRRPGEDPAEGGIVRSRQALRPGEWRATPAPGAASHPARDGAAVGRKRRVLGCRLYQADRQRRGELQSEVGLVVSRASANYAIARVEPKGVET